MQKSSKKQNVILWLNEIIQNKIKEIHNCISAMKMKNQNIKQEFGHRVRYYRKLKDLTQFQLSERIGKTEETVSNIERGMTSTGIELMEELAIALDIEIKDFFDEKTRVNAHLNTETFTLLNEIVAVLQKQSLKYLKSLRTIISSN